jgi:hypothetical protein
MTVRDNNQSRGEVPVHRSRAADDFETIRARMEELRREREAMIGEPDVRSAERRAGRGDAIGERRRRERIEGFPPPWVPTIFVKKGRP